MVYSSHACRVEAHEPILQLYCERMYTEGQQDTSVARETNVKTNISTVADSVEQFALYFIGMIYRMGKCTLLYKPKIVTHDCPMRLRHGHHLEASKVFCRKDNKKGTAHNKMFDVTVKRDSLYAPFCSLSPSDPAAQHLHRHLHSSIRPVSAFSTHSSYPGL